MIFKHCIFSFHVVFATGFVCVFSLDLKLYLPGRSPIYRIGIFSNCPYNLLRTFTLNQNNLPQNPSSLPKFNPLYHFFQSHHWPAKALGDRPSRAGSRRYAVRRQPRVREPDLYFHLPLHRSHQVPHRPQQQRVLR